MKILQPHVGTLVHYVGVAVLLVLSYFLVNSVIDRIGQRTDTLHGNAVTIRQPATVNKATEVAGRIADALKEKSLADAALGRDIQLSVAQQAIANTLQAAGVNARLAAAATEGLTRPSPKVQVIEVKSSAQPTKLQTEPVALTDDQIERSLKHVLATTTIPVKLDTDVHVKWEDRPFSPVFAAYGTGNYSGLGLTLKKSPLFNLDLLVMTKKVDNKSSFAFGPGIEHIFRGTSAGIGVNVLFDSGVHRVTSGVYVTTHF